MPVETPSAPTSGRLGGFEPPADHQGLLDPTGAPAASEGFEPVRFTVFGEAKSAGSKRAFRNQRTGQLIVTEAVKGSKAWQQQVASAGREAYWGRLLDGPLQLRIVFYRPRPRSHYGQGRNKWTLRPSAPGYPSTRPDVLKLARGVEDALTGVLWVDDARIVSELLFKRWGEPARAEVVVSALRESDAQLEL